MRTVGLLLDKSRLAVHRGDERADIRNHVPEDERGAQHRRERVAALGVVLRDQVAVTDGGKCRNGPVDGVEVAHAGAHAGLGDAPVVV